MKKITLLFALLLVSLVGNAQAHHWANQLAGTTATPFDVKIKDIVPLTDNELYIVGHFSGTVDFDFSASTNNVTAVGTDAFVARYNDSRELIWLYTTNVAGNEEANFALANTVISPLSERINVVMIENNTTFSIKSFDKNTGIISSTTPNNVATGTVKINDLELDPATNTFYVSGSFSGSCNYGGTTNSTSAGQQDAFCAAFTLNTTGAFTFITHGRYGGTANEEVMDAAFDKATNNLVIVGNYEGTCDFDTVTPGVLTRSSLGGKDGFVFKCTNTNLKPTSNSAIQVYRGSNFSSVDCAVVHNNQLNIGVNFLGVVDLDPGNFTTPWIENAQYKTYNLICYNNISTNFTILTGYHYTPNSNFEFSITKLLLNATNNSVYIITKAKWNQGAMIIDFQKRGFPNYFSGSSFDRSIQLDSLLSDSVLKNNQTIDAFYFAGNFLNSAELNAGTGPTELDLFTSIGSTNNGFISKWASCLTVADVPVIQGGTVPVCAGQPVTLNVGTAKLNSRSVWKWYSGADCNGASIGSGSSITVNPTANTNYFVRAEGGCVANNNPICSVAKTVLVNTVSNQITITGNTMSSNEVGGTYQWYDCETGTNIAGATNQSFNPSTTGIYRVTVTSVNNCGPVTSACTDFTLLSTNDFSKLGIKLYPNPVKNNFTIESEVVIQKLTIFNLLGQKIKEFNNTNNYNIEELNSGTYIIEVITEKGTAKSKIIKE